MREKEIEILRGTAFYCWSFLEDEGRRRERKPKSKFALLTASLGL